MTSKGFLNAVTHGGGDVVQTLLQLLEESGADYCVIGGLAVNAYAAPVVSLDVDLAVAAGKLPQLRQAALARGLKVEAFEHSVNLTAPGSDLRIQLQTDPRYQAFIPRSVLREVLGYPMQVATIEDVLQGKVWAWQDARRRPSKRQKDLADILRLVEAQPELKQKLPREVVDRIP